MSSILARSACGLSLVVALGACTFHRTKSPSSPGPGAGGQGTSPGAAASPASVEEATKFVAEVNKDLQKLYLQRDRASWVNQTFITDDTDAIASSAVEVTMEYLGRKIHEAKRFEGLALPDDLARQIRLLKLAESAAAPSDPQARGELATVLTQMNSIYGKGKHCPDRLKGSKTPCLSLPDLSQTMAKSRKYDELLDAWTGWHAIAKPIRDKFVRYVELSNKGAAEIGFADLGTVWQSGYDMTPAQFDADVERLWQATKPLYDDLHCYVRARLQKHYGKDKIADKGPIPAHLLGNMWAQEWQNIFDLVAPYPGEASLDISRKLEQKKIEGEKLVKYGERFFTSLGMDALPQSFWSSSLFTKPKDRDVVCHASAWDIGSRDDLRIKMCIRPTEEDFVTVHHELGHVYYYHAYHTLPILFQNGANDGFHEGIGDTLALSVTPKYLKDLGLIDAEPKGDKGRTNKLMREALDKVAFLPFGLLIDKWRWEVFAGKVPSAKYNETWWDMRKKYQGVAAPIERTEQDFDAGAKYHIPANTSYMRYFLARFLQYQFHRALCKAAGHTGPIDTCSIYGNKAAGEKLQAMLKLGASKPWPVALASVSGETSIDPGALLEYYAPLQAYLKEQNKNQTCGW